MNKMMIAAGAGALVLCSMAPADALSLLYQEADEKTPPPPEEAEVAGPWYFAAAIGGTFALDADIKDQNGSYFKFNTGVGMNLGFGYAFNKTFALEVRSGVLWNGINSIQNFRIGTGTYGGGDGDLYQVPMMASLLVSFPISEKFSIGLKAGVGAQWTKFNSTVNSYNAGIFAGTNTWDNSSISFRYEVGVQLAHQITHNIKIGGGLIFSGTSEVSIGTPQLYTPAGAPVPTIGEDNLERIFNISLGFGVTVFF